jgi:protein-tyrosine phosphatase
MIRQLVNVAAALAIAIVAQGAALAAVSGEAAVRTTPGEIMLTWTDTNPVDVYVADRSDATPLKSRLLSKANRTGRLELPAAGGVRQYFLLKDTRDGVTTPVAERLVPLTQGSNFRDVGGYRAAGGRHVRWGVIFRSGATPLLTDADVAAVKGLGISSMVDLRSNEERSLAPTRLDGLRYSAIGYPWSRIYNANDMRTPDERGHGMYQDFPTLLAPQLRIVFRALLDHQGGLVINCSAGQDRTGFATAMILSALGVPREVIYQDYHLSTALRRPEYEMPRFDPAVVANNPTAALFSKMGQPGRKPSPLYDSQHRSLLEFSFAEIDGKWGSADKYLQTEIGLTAKDIAKLRALYLE